MTVFIIEDEQLGIDRLERQLKEIDASIRIVGTAESIKSSVQWLVQNDPPDLIFMDIELSDGQSFDIFHKTEVKSPIIFTTSYNEFALQAFKVNSVDYLLKPIKKEELRKGIEKFRQLKQQFNSEPAFNINQLIEELKQQQLRSFRSRFLVKQGQRLMTIAIEDIAYFFIDGRLTYLKTWDNRRYVVDYSLDDLLPMLNPDQFHRINRSFIIQVRSIEQVHTYFNGKLKLLLSPEAEKEVLVSREYASTFKEWLGK